MIKDISGTGPMIEKYVTLKDGISVSCRARNVHYRDKHDANEHGYGYLKEGEWLADIYVTAWNKSGKKLSKKIYVQTLRKFHVDHKDVKPQRLKRKTILREAKKLVRELRNDLP
jgi:hypothetical protein